jgi:hypothetical protein
VDSRERVMGSDRRGPRYIQVANVESETRSNEESEMLATRTCIHIEILGIKNA